MCKAQCNINVPGSLTKKLLSIAIIIHAQLSKHSIEPSMGPSKRGPPETAQVKHTRDRSYLLGLSFLKCTMWRL